MLTKLRPSQLLSLSLVSGLLASGLLASCESTQGSISSPPPAPIDSVSAGLGISLEITETLGTLRKDTYRPDLVLFVRLDPDETVPDLSKARVLIPSTLTRGGDAYLLNASPGTYAAVAAIYGEDVGATTMNAGNINVGSSATVGFSLELSDGKVVHRNYFSREMIAQNTTKVEAGKFAFMGRYSTDQSFRFGEGDDLQVHFLRVLEGDGADRSGLFQDLSSEGRAHRLTVRTGDKSRDAERAFFKDAKQRLEKTAWVPIIDGSLAGR